jgi:pyruvate formate lyase activating enzyme
MPPVRGLDPMSLTAWEGRVAAVIHLQGCNLACPGCPTPHLVARNPGLGTIPLESVLESVYTRRRWLDAVVVSGGEPTIHEGLPELVRLLHDFGLVVRLHTNGSHPDVLRAVLDAGDVASVSMTLRAPLDPTYTQAAGTKVRLAALYESVERLLRDDGEHEFRVPWLTGVVEAEQMISVLRMLAGARRVVLEPGLDGRPGVRPLRRVGRAAGHYVESCVVAGRPSEDFGRSARSRAAARGRTAS